MNRILIDTMYISALLTNKNSPYFDFAQAIEDDKIAGIVSAVTLTELVKILGAKVYKKKIDQLISSNLRIIDVSQLIAIRAGELRLKYDIPTADSMIAATGVVENIRHILTDDDHFEATKNLIKPIDLKTAMKLI
ncbi:MAG: PIN domain-containing protein [Candidatus Methanoperedens sp.]|nr:PIN domain-containing protein [Candidatus Methanoperedens sp.]MCZ7406560.1 PIN domain-containing protein [Candidatus Methanoperedens sp.]